MIGDQDGDGVADVCVGAPGYDNGAGAVFIYSGQKLLQKYSSPSQVIKASALNPSLKGFGISFSHPVDIDDNECSDIAVGAHNSNNAVILRSQPVLALEGKITFDRNSINAVTNIFTMNVLFR